MNLDEAIRHCKDVAESKRKQVENGDWEKGSPTERDCIECAAEHRQLAEWLKELKAYREKETCETCGHYKAYQHGADITTMDDECGGCCSWNSKWIPNICGDAISRQAVLNGLASIAKVRAKSDAQKSLMGRAMFFAEQLPPVTPQQRTGRWIEVIDETDSLGNKTWHHECSICGSDKSGWGTYKHCPDCGTKMEVEE